MVDLKRSNDPIWFTDVYRVDTEIILKSINWRYFYSFFFLILKNNKWFEIICAEPVEISARFVDI
jgi:hypothetical protein